MPESELWITSIFNDYLPGVGNAALQLVGPASGTAPVGRFHAILVVAILMVIFAMLRPQLSVDRPGGLQHVFEMFYNFVKSQAEDRPSLASLRGFGFLLFEPDRSGSDSGIAHYECLGDVRVRAGTTFCTIWPA